MQRVVVDAVVDTTDGYAKLQVEGLRSGTWYSFALLDDRDGTRSGISRFQTAPAAGCAPVLTVAATACTHQRNAPFRALERMAEAQPDLFLQLGDMVYNDGATREAVQLLAGDDIDGAKAAYRRNWQTALSDPGYEALLSGTGSYFTWDDHEITNDSGLYDLDETTRQFAIDRYFEALAQPRLGENRFWDSYRWGDTAEFFVLDSRGERVVESRLREDATYLSRAQMDWFKSALVASPCHFKVVLNSVPMTAWPETMSVVEDDRWQGYKAQRDELLDFVVAEEITNLWFVSGDFHCGAVSSLERSGPLSGVYEILAGPGGNGNNPLVVLWEMTNSEASKAELAPPEQFAFLRSQPAATLLVLDPTLDRVGVRYLDPDTGAVIWEASLKAGEPIDLG